MKNIIYYISVIFGIIFLIYSTYYLIIALFLGGVAATIQKPIKIIGLQFYAQLEMRKMLLAT